MSLFSHTVLTKGQNFSISLRDELRRLPLKGARISDQLFCFDKLYFPEHKKAMAIAASGT